MRARADDPNVSWSGLPPGRLSGLAESLCGKQGGESFFCPAATHFVLPVPDRSFVIDMKLDVTGHAKGAWPGAQNPPRSAAPGFGIHDGGKPEAIDVELTFCEGTAVVTDVRNADQPGLFGQSGKANPGGVTFRDAGSQSFCEVFDAIGDDDLVGTDPLRPMDGSLSESHRQQHECDEQDDSVIARHRRLNSSRKRHVSSQLASGGGLSLGEGEGEGRWRGGQCSQPACWNHQVKASFR